MLLRKACHARAILVFQIHISGFGWLQIVSNQLHYRIVQVDALENIMRYYRYIIAKKQISDTNAYPASGPD